MRFVLKEKKITTPFGGKTPFQLRHWGVDYRSAFNNPVYAPRNGIIVRKWWNTLSGNNLAYRDDEDFLLTFRHLNNYGGQITGDEVKESEIIAYSGNSGIFSTAPHLHLETRDPNNKLIDPEEYFKKEVILNKDEYVERTFRFAVALWEFTHLGQHPDEKSISKDLEDVFDGKISAWDLEQKWRRGE